MDSFEGDMYGDRCHLGMKSSDIFNDFLNVKQGVVCRPSRWCLNSLATIAEYVDWERNMERGFHRCRRYNDKFSSSDGYGLAYRRVDKELASYWYEAIQWGEFDDTWEDFKKKSS